MTNTDEVVESSKNNLNDNIDDNEADPLRESKCVDEEVLPLSLDFHHNGEKRNYT